MSNESFKTFLAKVQKDEGLRSELRAAGGEAGMPVEAVVAFAAGKGYDFKVEDVSSELSDTQLDSVAGGGLTSYKLESYNLNTFLKIDGQNIYLSSAGNLMDKH